MFPQLKIPKIIFLLVFAMLSQKVLIFACTCVQRGSPEEEFLKATAVFSGRVVEIQKARQYQEVKFEILKSLKGPDTNAIVVRTNNHPDACGYTFNKGESYLVYAHGEYTTSICTRSKLLSTAKERESELEVISKLGDHETCEGLVPLSKNSRDLRSGKTFAINDEDNWKLRWRNESSRPKVNFSSCTVLVASMGQRPTGGYSIKIDSVDRSERETLIHVVQSSPGTSCMTTQALTNPIHVVKTKKIEAPYRFVFKNKITSCK